MTDQIIPIEAQEKISESTELAKTYENFSVTTAEVYAGAGNDLLIIKTKIKELDTLRKSLTKPLDESKKRIMELFKAPLAYLDRVRISIDSAMVNWNRKQEEIRQAEQARLLEAQRKETERLAKLAEKAEERGDESKAEEFKERAAVVESTALVVASKVEKVAGLTKTVNWKFRIVDVNKIPREYMLPDEVKIGQIGRVTKGAAKIEGIEFYPEESMRSVRH